MDDDIPMSGWSIDPDVRSSLRLDRIRQAAEREDWSEVALEAEELLDEEPDHAEALFLLGEALLELGQPEVAVKAYEHRVRVAGDEPDVLLGLGLACYELCDLPRAIECLREVVRQVPDHAEAHFSLGLAQEASGNDSEAASAFQAAQLLAPDTYPAPMQLTDGDWRAAVGEAVAALPPTLAPVLDGLRIQLVDRPTIEELRAHHPPLPPSVAALLDGDPGDDDSDTVRPPEGLRVFTRVLARQPTFDDLVTALAHALLIETADWLGVDPEPAP
jgi:tetratricopeptide (TPR) repeat protein